MDVAVPVEISFGNSKQWMECRAKLAYIAQSLNLVLTTSRASTRGFRDSSQFIVLENLTSCYSVCQSAVRPECLDLVRPKSYKRITISFKAFTVKEDWRLVLCQYIKRGSITAPVSPQIERPYSLEILTKASESSSQNGQPPPADINIYESLDDYAKPPLPPRNLSPVEPELPARNSLNFQPIPLLPTHRKISVTELYDSVNTLLTNIHRLSLQIECSSIPEECEQTTSSPAPQTGTLIDLSDPGESRHFDSIPLPNYPSPRPTTDERSDKQCEASEYLQPTQQQSEFAINKPEPIYAKINKKKKLPAAQTPVDADVQRSR